MDCFDEVRVLGGSLLLGVRFLSRRDLNNSKRVYFNRELLPGSNIHFDSVEAVLLNVSGKICLCLANTSFSLETNWK